MKSFNQAIIIGHVTKEPEVKVINSKSGEVKVAKFGVATSTGGYTKKDGTQVPETTQFHRIVAWRGLAEYCEKSIHKGDAVTITGEINYSDVENNGVKTHFTDIVAEEVILCHSKNGVPQQANPMQNVPAGGYTQQIPQQAPMPQYNQPQYAQQPYGQPYGQPMGAPQPNNYGGNNGNPYPF